MEKVSVVVTVKNDDRALKILILDLKKQAFKPDEVIIIQAKDYGDCSRGKGRNIGIKKARNKIIAVTDAGCRPHRDWLAKLTVPLFKNEAEVSGGFYKAIAKTNLQRAIVPFLAVKWDKGYLPASRSMAFTKKVWKKVGGYPEKAEHGGEDLEFARKLKNDPEIRMQLVPGALVDWEVPDNFWDFAKDIYKHTYGNFEIRYWPHILRNLSVVARWVLFAVWPWLLVGYLAWVLGKGREGWFWLPIVQAVTDIVVIVTIVIWALDRTRLKVSAGWVG